MIRSIPRPEHPHPDFQRENWLNLNGEWQFAFDGDEIGLGQAWHEPGYALPEKITVPFCYQSKLSGLHDKRICPVVWYKRSFELPEAMRGKRVYLRFGAVDYRCQAYVNGECAGEHVGGYTPFGFDITAWPLAKGSPLRARKHSWSPNTAASRSRTTRGRTPGATTTRWRTRRRSSRATRK
jgi:beta-galactosidase/beta-glucuronidase